MKRTTTVAAASLVVVLLALGTWLLVRPGSTASSVVHEAVIIECTAATGVDATRCGTWGDAILAEDAAPRTFEREDLRTLRIDRSLLGLGGECTADFFLSRYPDTPVWTAEVSCR